MQAIIGNIFSIIGKLMNFLPWFMTMFFRGKNKDLKHNIEKANEEVKHKEEVNTLKKNQKEKENIEEQQKIESKSEEDIVKTQEKIKSSNSGKWAKIEG